LKQRKLLKINLFNLNGITSTIDNSFMLKSNE
jgi:hypothetical protein